MKKKIPREECYVQIKANEVLLDGDLCIPDQAKGIVVFAHGTGSNRYSPRNQYVAGVLREVGLATLLFGLLTVEEEAEDLITGKQRFDIAFLSRRLIGVTDWLQLLKQSKHLRLGYFGASTGAAAALVAAVERADIVGAVVSRGGRPDMAMSVLNLVTVPTLLIVGGNDQPVIKMNQTAFEQLHSVKEIVIVPGATHLFEESGTLEEVAILARDWFARYLL